MKLPADFASAKAKQESSGGAPLGAWVLALLTAILGLMPVNSMATTNVANYAKPYTFTTLAGQAGSSGTANGTGSAARFSRPYGLAVDGAGNIYIADGFVIRKVSPAGVVTNLMAGGAGVLCVAVDSATNIYLTVFESIERLTQTTPGAPWTGAVLVEGTNALDGVAVDKATNLYVANYSQSVIQRVTPIPGIVTNRSGQQFGTNWVFTTLAGLAGTPGPNDGTGSAARFSSPTSVALDGATNLYVTDSGNFTIRKMTLIGTNWVVTTIAGLPGIPGFNDGTGSAAKFSSPGFIAIDSTGNLYVSDYTATNLYGPPYVYDDSIRKITLVGTNWVTTTLGGMAGAIGTNDGTGSVARFNAPAGVAVDGAGNLYVADSDNYTIRRGFPANGAPVILTNGTGLAVSNSQFGFNLSAATGQPVVVDASTDLVTWASIWTNTVGPGILPFSDPQSGIYSNRFYRAHLP